MVKMLAFWANTQFLNVSYLVWKRKLNSTVFLCNNKQKSLPSELSSLDSKLVYLVLIGASTFNNVWYISLSLVSYRLNSLDPQIFKSSYKIQQTNRAKSTIFANIKSHSNHLSYFKFFWSYRILFVE